MIPFIKQHYSELVRRYPIGQMVIIAAPVIVASFILPKMICAGLVLVFAAWLFVEGDGNQAWLYALSREQAYFQVILPFNAFIGAWGFPLALLGRFTHITQIVAPVCGLLFVYLLPAFKLFRKRARPFIPFRITYTVAAAAVTVMEITVLGSAL